MTCNWGSCKDKIDVNPKTGKHYHYCKFHRNRKNKRNRDLYLKNGGLANERNKQYCARLRYKFLEMYGNKCACCGESFEPFLTLDHVKGNGSQERKTKNGRPANSYNAYRNSIKDYDTSAYQILCMNCNFAKKNNNGKVCPCRNREKNYRKPRLICISL